MTTETVCIAGNRRWNAGNLWEMYRENGNMYIRNKTTWNANSVTPMSIRVFCWLETSLAICSSERTNVTNNTTAAPNRKRAWIIQKFFCRIVGKIMQLNYSHKLGRYAWQMSIFQFIRWFVDFESYFEFDQSYIQTQTYKYEIIPVDLWQILLWEACSIVVLL